MLECCPCRLPQTCCGLPTGLHNLQLLHGVRQQGILTKFLRTPGKASVRGILGRHETRRIQESVNRDQAAYGAKLTVSREVPEVGGHQPGRQDDSRIAETTVRSPCRCSATRNGITPRRACGSRPWQAHAARTLLLPNERQLNTLTYQVPAAPASATQFRCIRQVSSLSTCGMQGVARDSTHCMRQALDWLEAGPLISNVLPMLVGAERFELPTPCFPKTGALTRTALRPDSAASLPQRNSPWQIACA